MPSRGETKRALLGRWIAERSPERIGPAEFGEIRRSIGPVSESYLRKLLRETGVPLTPEVEGVVTSSLDDLRRTLMALADVYENDPNVRRIVIEAKTRLKWAEARATEGSKKALRAEMVLWTMTWLENPGAFEIWVGLRERAIAGSVQ